MILLTCVGEGTSRQEIMEMEFFVGVESSQAN